MNFGQSNQARIVIALILSTSLLAQAGDFQMISIKDSTLPASGSGGGFSGVPILTPDGRFVVFDSTAENLVVTTNNVPSSLSFNWLNVFVRDRANGTTRLASPNLAGTGGGNNNSFPSGISTNGQFVLFESAANDLITGDTNESNDVFVRDVVNGTTTLVSTGLNGANANGASRSSNISADGRFVAFVSAATNLVTGDSNGIADVFVRDLVGNTTTLASVGAKPKGVAGPTYFSESPEITPDGRYVAFYSTATNLVPNSTASGEVYVRDLVAGITYWASTNARAVYFSVTHSSNAVSCNQVISSDGRYVAFETCTNAGSGSISPGIIMRSDLQTGVTDVIHTNAYVSSPMFESIDNLNITPDGRFIVFVANTNASATCIYRWDALTAGLDLVSGSVSNTVSAGTFFDWPTVDASGRYVAFASTALNLTTNTLSGTTNDYHLYVRDTVSGITSLAGKNLGGTGAVVSPVSPASQLSEDGQLVAFESTDETLVANDSNREEDVFAFNVGTDTNELVSSRDSNLPSQAPNGRSSMSSSCISTNGRFIAFASSAANLTLNDTNENQDVFVRDLLTGTNILVSADTNGVSGNGYSLEPSISGNGRYVAFVSWATNLVASDTNNAKDVFIRDLSTGTITLISVRTNGISPGNFESYSPTISSDGRYVLFWSKANNLASGSFGNGTIENLFLRDVQTATTYPLTTAASGIGVSFASMIPDGHRVIFAGIVPGSTATRVAVWDSQLAARIYTNNASSPSFVAISPDGNKIVYVTGAANLNAADLVANTNWVINTGKFTYNLGLRFSANSQLLAYAIATNGSSQGQNIFLYDFQTGTNSLISKGWAFNPANTPAFSPDISADGRYVAYRSSVTNSLLPDLNTVSDIFLHDRFNDATILVSVNNRGNSTANQRAFAPMFSDDGKTFVFQSWASDQFDNDFNQTSDLFALHLGLPDWLDSDGDGMNDQWEMDYFPTLDRSGTGDFDGDGVSDLLEFQAGTNPTNPASVFRADIGSPENPGVGAAISWPAAAWKSYRVQFKTNLNDAIWQDLNADISVINNKAKITDPSAAGQRFYRILLNN